MIKKRILSEEVAAIFASSYDFEMRDIRLGLKKQKAKLCFIDGLVSGNTVGDTVIAPLTDWVRMLPITIESLRAEEIAAGGVFAYTAKQRETAEEVAEDLLRGFTALLLDDEHKAVTFETKSGDKRSIGEPSEEKVMKGAKDGFIEVLKTNTAMVRKKLRNKNLVFKEIILGRDTNTAAVIAYIRGYTSEKLVYEMQKRLNQANLAGALATGWVEEYLQDAPHSIFPQLITTERTDRFCLNLLEGRVGLLIDGLPIGYLAPGTFSQFFKAPEDISGTPFWGTVMIILRYISFFLAIFLPAFYVAVVMYHQEMLPTKMLLSIVEAKQRVPFSTGAEILLMLLSFELLQEAGLRLPNSIGQTISIVGALIVGQSAVDAKVLSPVVVIVVAVAGIAGYVMPNQEMGTAVRVLRFGMVLAAVFLGMAGVALGGVLLMYRLCSMESFGIAYLSPLADSEKKGVWRAFCGSIGKQKDQRETALKKERKNAR